MAKKKDIHTETITITSNDAPFQFVEAYKSLRTNLQFASVSQDHKRIVVTSSIPGEGKSTVSINLAFAVAGSEDRVLLIDADLRKPALHRYLHLNGTKIGGLSNILSGVRKSEECIIHFNDSRINFLSAGPIPPNPAELLGSRRMEMLIESLSSQYDYIIFDTPPVSVVTDAAVLSKLTDGVIFVIRQNYATIETAQLAKRNLENVGATVIGSVLNNFKADKSNNANYQHYKRYDYVYQ